MPRSRSMCSTAINAGNRTVLSRVDSELDPPSVVYLSFQYVRNEHSHDRIARLQGAEARNKRRYRLIRLSELLACDCDSYDSPIRQHQGGDASHSSNRPSLVLYAPRIGSRMLANGMLPVVSKRPIASKRGESWYKTASLTSCEGQQISIGDSYLDSSQSWQICKVSRNRRQ